MKKAIFLILIISLVAGIGCSRQNKPAIVIDDLMISPEEFEQAFRLSRFSSDGAKGREEFLDTYIHTKLILKEAERIGLDKDPEFLSEIQFFWEKALLKLSLTKKLEEIASRVNVSDKEIRDYYKQHRKDYFADKELLEAYNQIKWALVHNKRSSAVAAWADSLKRRANIRVEKKALGIKK